jgi:phosphatidylserine/phosphatidylglycerophosphate/cardiolipin synthase-like enzyme
MARYLAWFLLSFLALGCDGNNPLSIPKPLDSASTSTASGTVQGDGSLQVFFTRPQASPQEPGNIAQKLAGFIDQTQKTLDVCAHELDNKVITEALVRAVKRGVQVRLVTETQYLDESGIQALKAVGVPVVDDQRDSALMHNKFMVFDQGSVWTGSMNFTENCAYRNDNHGIYIRNPQIAANYATKFAWLFEQKKFGGKPNSTARIPNPVVTLGDGTVIENYFSTHDKVADRLIDKINQANRSIRFLAFSFTHDGMALAMLRRSASGVLVQGVFEKTQAVPPYSEFDRLQQAGLSVFHDANPRNMHHKVIVLDDETTVAGSFNFSDNADTRNDENVVIIRSQDVAKRFQEEFQRVFSDAQQPGSLAGR